MKHFKRVSFGQIHLEMLKYARVTMVLLTTRTSTQSVHSREFSLLLREVTVDLKLCCPRTDYGLVLVII